MVEVPSQKIIIALDGSLVANNAADVAIEIAQAESLLIEGLYIVDEPLVFDPYANYSRELGSDRKVNSRSQLIDLFETIGLETLTGLEVKCKSKGVAVTTNMYLGNVPDLILENAKGAFFLALGRRGNSHVNDIDYLGEYFRQIVHHTPVPLILGGDLVRPIKQIFLIYDGSKEANRALKWARYLRESLSARMSIGLAESDEREIDLALLNTQFSEENLAVDDILHLEHRSINGIVDSINHSQADIVVMGGYRRSEFVAWFAGSPVDQIIRQISLPILIA